MFLSFSALVLVVVVLSWVRERNLVLNDLPNIVLGAKQSWKADETYISYHIEQCDFHGCTLNANFKGLL